VAKVRLTADKTLKKRTSLTVDDIIQLLSFVLKTTYFSFGGNIYQQKFGTAMGSPVSPLIADLFMENLEQKAIDTAPVTCKPRLWKRYVDDILAIIPKGTTEELNTHLNNVDITGNIKFTNEEMTDNSIAFLDVNITVKADRRLKTQVYRKKTHTNQYLSFQSEHPVTHKLGVVRTLLDRCQSHVTDAEDQRQEEKYVKDVLRMNHYPDWTIKRVKDQKERKASQLNQNKKQKNSENKSRGHVVLPYEKGLSEKISATFNSYNIGTSFKPHTKLRSILVHPKDKIKDPDKCGVVYEVACANANCDKVYIGETGRKLETRIKEHRKDVEQHAAKGVSTRSARIASTGDTHKSAITDHVVEENHVADWQGVKILTREPNTTNRQIREAIWIRKKKTMNRDEGGYQLSNVYNSLLQARPSRGGGRGQLQ